jgi:hypothetical protein
MAPDSADPPDSNDSTGAAKKEKQPPEDKAARLERERAELLTSVAGGDLSTKMTRVAGVLNLYPHTRNSDVALTLKYWEMFQADLYDPTGILPRDLFKLERETYIARARAKIQNEYGLFQADENVRRHRRNLEEDMREEVIENAAPRRLMNIFADETGKTHTFVIVAAIWVISGHAVFSVAQAIRRWQSQSPWAEREVHFSKFGRNDMDPLREYIRVVQGNREFLSFKVAAVERARTRRSIEEVVFRLHEHMLVRGADHEISTGRIDLPRDVEVTIDEEQSLDNFALNDMKQRVAERYEHAYGGGLTLRTVQTASSKKSTLIQLADLVAGTINRRLNPQEARNYKDEMADLVIDELGLAPEEEDFPDLDSSALFRV